jgi:HK97 family phage major capsid protein
MTVNTANSFQPDNVAMIQLLNRGVNPLDGTYQDIALEQLAYSSIVTRLGKAVDMGGNLTKKFMYQTEGLGAYWVNETERIRTSKAKLVTAEMTAHKLGLIVPVSQEWLKFGPQAFWAKVMPDMQAAIQKKIDEAVLLGIDAPGVQGSVKGFAEKSGHAVQGPINYDNMQKLQDLIFDANGAYNVNALVSRRSNRSALSNAYQTQGGTDVIIDRPFNKNDNSYDGIPVIDSTLNTFPAKTVLAGDWNNLYYAVPRGFEFSLSDTATLRTLENADGTPVDMFEQDMVALKVTFYFGYLIIKDDAFAIVEPVADAANLPVVGIDMISEKWHEEGSDVYYNHARLNGETTRVIVTPGVGATYTVDLGDATDTTHVVEADGSLFITTGKNSGKVTITATVSGVDSEPVELYVGSAKPSDAPAEA